MDEIEYYTDWRPSPGSVYPLLAKLETNGLIKPIESGDPSLKRYTITHRGEITLEEQLKLKPNIRFRFNSISKIYWKLVEGIPEDVFKAYSELSKEIEKIIPTIKTDSNISMKLQIALKNTTETIKTISSELENQ